MPFFELKNKNTRTIRTLQLHDEISGMKRQKLELLHKTDAEKRRFQALLREKTREVESMRRAAQ